MAKSRLLTFIVKELRKVLPPTVFFGVGFNLIVLTELKPMPNASGASLPQVGRLTETHKGLK
jgi:hypothetical protein